MLFLLAETGSYVNLLCTHCYVLVPVYMCVFMLYRRTVLYKPIFAIPCIVNVFLCSSGRVGEAIRDVLPPTA